MVLEPLCFILWHADKIIFVSDLLPNVSTAAKPLADITVICVAAIFGLQRHPH